ncbi:MAG: hypothetical protein JSS24_15060, partial [Proteobacteria bacterium]|nr:hypothetical protein [Pseudomonadota bacterium]
MSLPQTASAPEFESTVAAIIPPAPAKGSYRRFRTLLQPYAAEKKIGEPIFWFVVDWVVLAATI